MAAEVDGDVPNVPSPICDDGDGLPDVFIMPGLPILCNSSRFCLRFDFSVASNCGSFSIDCSLCRNLA